MFSRTASMILIAACGGTSADVERGPVDVIAWTELTNPIGPDHGALILFVDRDGTSRSAYIEQDGRASGEVEVGGSVWHIRANVGSNTFTAYMDVQPGSTLEFGPVSAPAPVTRGTMTVAGDPTVANLSVRLYATCAAPTPIGERTLTFDDRCGATADILAVGYELSGAGDRLLSYAFLPAQPIVDNTTITIAPSAWRDPEEVSIRFTNAGGSLELVNTSDLFRITNAFGIEVNTSNARIVNDTITARLPLVGPDLRVRLHPKRGTGQPGQEVQLTAPAVASQDFDLGSVLAPWVERDASQVPIAWTVDDVGGALEADAMVTEFGWVQPIGNFEETNQLRLISSPQLGGMVELPELPDALSDHEPEPGFQVDAGVRLIRITSTGSVDPMRVAGRLIWFGPGLNTPPLRSTAVLDSY